MSDSNVHRKHLGFSTGALEKENFQKAIDWSRNEHIGSVELSALRLEELEPLVARLDELCLEDFDYVSFHAPSAFAPEEEGRVIELLRPVYQKGWNIIIHPDVIYTPRNWITFGEQLLIENMDDRKPTGRTVAELHTCFSALPHARMCLDLAHARHIDTTLGLLGGLVRHYADRIAEIHISELDSKCRHHPMSMSAVNDYRPFADRISAETPVIIESVLPSRHSELRRQELNLTERTLRGRAFYTTPQTDVAKACIAANEDRILEREMDDWQSFEDPDRG